MANRKMIKFIAYKDAKGNSRWRIISGNGKKAASGGEWFVKRYTEKQFKRLQELFLNAVYINEERIPKKVSK